MTITLEQILMDEFLETEVPEETNTQLMTQLLLKLFQIENN